MALTHAHVVQFLAETDYFQELDLLNLSAISSRFEVLSISGGSCLFSAGDPGDAWFIVVEGQIEIWGPTPSGESCLLTCLNPRDSFGELSLLEDVKRTAAAVASTDTALLRLPRKAFLRLLEDGNPAAIQLLRALSIRMGRRMREMSKTIQDLQGQLGD